MRRLLLCLLHCHWLLQIKSEAAGNDSVLSSNWTARSFGRSLQQCLSGGAMWQCLSGEAERWLDAAALDKSSWQLSEYMSLEPELETENQTAAGKSARSGSGLTEKLLQLAQGRALRLRLPRQLTISNAIDELEVDQGTVANVDDKVDKLLAGFGSFDMHATTTVKKKTKKKKYKPKKKKKKKKKEKKKKEKKKKKKGKGRKKKDKDKNMAMMGGMIMMATFAQMFLGKVILIAGSAFIMAKIALAISLLGSLKKGSAGSGSGSSPEHVIVASGGHSHESGWHRSMPSQQWQTTTAEPEQDQDQAYYAYEATEMQRRRAAIGAV
ncbi:Osi10 [Drosophila busckii]|uniref:Osi10 n=1 Tax=Drosophila busckii TaxID=30019 RepID=A0A0M4EPN1_DROBS|nr:Osi10 [Drosophila busckii]